MRLPRGLSLFTLSMALVLVLSGLSIRSSLSQIGGSSRVPSSGPATSGPASDGKPVPPSAGEPAVPPTPPEKPMWRDSGWVSAFVAILAVFTTVLLWALDKRHKQSHSPSGTGQGEGELPHIIDATKNSGDGDKR